MCALRICNRVNLISVQIPGDNVHSAIEHAEILWTRTVLGKSRQSEENPERSLVAVDAQQCVLLLESSGFQHVVRRVDQKLAVNSRRPRKHLLTLYTVSGKKSTIFTSAKEVMFLSVFVCLCVYKITQKIMDRSF